MLNTVAQTLSIALPESLPQGGAVEHKAAHAAYLTSVRSLLRQAAATELPCNGGLPYGYVLSAKHFKGLRLPAPVLALTYPVSAQQLKYQPPPVALDCSHHIVLCLHRTGEALPDKLRRSRAPHGGLSIIRLYRPRGGEDWLLEPDYHLLPYQGRQALNVTLSPRIVPFRNRAGAPAGTIAKPSPQTAHAIGVALQALSQMTAHGEREFPAPAGGYRA